MKILLRALASFPRLKLKKSSLERFLRNPFFYFGIFSLLLLGFSFFSAQNLSQTTSFGKGDGTAFAKTINHESDPFFSQNQTVNRESPDLKISQGSFIAAISAPHVLNTQVLGSIFGDSESARREIIDYTVQDEDTVKSIAQEFNVSPETIIWANDLSKNSKLKPGQSLTILPVSGVLHIARSGDTVSELAKKYKSQIEDIIAFNNLANEGDIFIGDILIIPGGTMPEKASPSLSKNILAQGSWIYPLLKFKETQGLHFLNAVDLSSLDGCGSPVYAVAGGVVQRAVGNGGRNFEMGNYVTILHPNGVVTYYGHLNSVLARPGDKVNVGDRIGSEGQSGEATGCHVHFQVMGAENYIAQRVKPGQIIDVTK